MVSDFTTDGKRSIAWQALTNPSMAVYYPVFFHHDGLASPYDDYMSSTAPWFNFRYVTYTLCAGSTKKDQFVKDTWRPIQQRFFKDAEAAAATAAGMEAAEANTLLAGITKNVSATIQATLKMLNETLPG